MTYLARPGDDDDARRPGVLLRAAEELMTRGVWLSDAEAAELRDAVEVPTRDDGDEA